MTELTSQNESEKSNGMIVHNNMMTRNTYEALTIGTMEDKKLRAVEEDLL